ncbi:hypothetical protein BDV18DRAFT_160319 [Aspergillus unguis]
METAVLVRLKEQNAALIIRKQVIDCEATVIFEAFETSPLAEPTLAANTLQWDFPGSAVSVPYTVFHDPAFQHSLASFLEKASVEPLEQFSVKSSKAGVKVAEDRNTPSPAIITQFLMTLLEANGNRISVPVLRKRVKDDVCWDNAKLPWRRSPFWLALRVCVQRLLYLNLTSEVGRMQYKAMINLFLSKLLSDGVSALPSENYHLLKVKLCRRMAKLDNEKDALTTTRHAIHAYMHVIRLMQSHLASIDTATTALEIQWSAWRQDFRRRVPKLPSRSSPEDSFLTLPNSIGYIREILRPRKLSIQIAKRIDPKRLEEIAVRSTSKQFAQMTKTYSALAYREAVIGSTVFETPSTPEAIKGNCIELSSAITTYIDAVGDAYDGDSEQMSLFILNVFELFVAMDKLAIAMYPLLKDYHPWFHPESLDALLLERWKHMKRLQAIQNHLATRCQQAKSNMTIFDGPERGCFAERYFDQAGSLQLQGLQMKILEDSRVSKEEKGRELENVNSAFDDLTAKLRLSTCTQRLNPDDGSHDIRGCSHCFFLRSRRRLGIEVHEDFLPSNFVDEKTVVFELRTPEAFAAYREATWTIVNRLCPKIEASPKARPELLLAQYSQLEPYNNNRNPTSVCLASTTKSFLGTHYGFRRLPARSEDVLLPHGLQYSYYDPQRQLFISEYPETITFAHHLKLNIPKEFPFSTLYSSSSFAADAVGPSSYETASSIGECPSELTIHEFTAHQDLVAGKNRRWLSILAELGSSNVNLSLQDTMMLFHRLVLQVGPRLENESMRAVHVILKDFRLCSRLAEQISRHLESIATNWRETTYMETLLTLSLRLFLIGHLQTRATAKKLLLRIRQITKKWVIILQDETRNTEDVNQSDRAARYRFLSALLCRRTFLPWLTSQTALDSEGLACFFIASLAMQESLVVDLSKFSTLTRNLLVRDIKMVSRMSSLLQTGAMKHSNSIGAAINAILSEADNKQRQFEAWTLLPSPYENWATSETLESEGNQPQTFYFDILHGHLVVDGRTIGKLPADIRDSAILKELFGNQRLFAIPSSLPGMEHFLLNRAENHEVHVGWRNEQLVIQARALRAGSLLELVPRGVFGSGPAFDLPYSLISDCVHWIDLRTGLIEIRPKPRIWKRRAQNWTIDILNRKAQRRESVLIDPSSQLFQMVAKIFLHFEHPCQLIMYQSPAKILIELKRMELSFLITNGQLKCLQLDAIVDRNQDPGTLYGLQSMLVMKDAADWSQRSIIIPLGPPRFRRHRSHVLIQIDHSGNYMKYTINDVLRRLECPADPQLLYSKSYLHALTSHPIADPLTGRTGTQEALDCLRSGYCQPWIRLSHDSFQLLSQIANLAPRRNYYPKDKRCQQTVTWDPNLTAHIQHEEFQAVVGSIVKKSQRLSRFFPDSPHQTLAMNTDLLCQRARWRRSLFESSDMLSPEPDRPKDFVYTPRDGWQPSERIANVREVVTLLCKQPESIHTTRNLVEVFEQWQNIGGYKNRFNLYDIGDCLSADISQEWGGLVNLCRQTKKQDVYSLMLQLALIAFGSQVNMTALRVILSFFLVPELRSLPLPQFQSFLAFRNGEKPTVEKLLPIIRMSYQTPRPTKAQKKRQGSATDENAGFGYDSDCEREGRELAGLLLRQWPCVAPSVEGFEPDWLDLTEAMKAILPEWTRMFQNLQLQRHVAKVQTILNRHYLATNEVPPSSSLSLNHGQQEMLGPRRGRDFMYPRLEDVFGKEVLNTESTDLLSVSKIPIQPKDGGLSSADHSKIPESRAPPKEVIELEGMVNKLGKSVCSTRSRYAQDLTNSITALKSIQRAPDCLKPNQIKDLVRLDDDVKIARGWLDVYYRRITDSISAHDESFVWLSKGGLWPQLTPVTILQQLRSTTRKEVGPGMGKLLISYALAITRLQKTMRIREAAIKRDESKIKQELADPGHVNWNPSDFPDWLVMEADANIQIRQKQVTVAMEMISPATGSNSVLQLNMGEGKTSVIMPMVALVLANGFMLNRLLVPKPLVAQACQILQSRLGGLLNREIIHVPFSRRTKTTVSLIEEYRDLHLDMLQNSGIILGVPEHVLSFKLSGLQRLADSKLPEATTMIETQKWMDDSCRDVLDECDFTLAVKTQLIYPGGAQLSVDGHPERWQVAMTVLGLVARHLNDLVREYPQSIDVLERNSTGFPVVHFLRKDVEEALVRKLADDICEKRTPLLPLGECNERAKDAIKLFITHGQVDKSVTKRIQKLFPDSPKARKVVYLLRGLLVHGILILCLKKRWNVSYGLDHRRDPIAVPFHAKGCPSDQAEWGHPDVAILFTCLAFYYEGLSQSQIKQSIDAVLKSDHPATEYERWIQDSVTLPAALRHWNSISVDDEGLVYLIWKSLRFTPVVINHFLNHFVFPLHAKQFATKMQASGWDVLLNNNSSHYRSTEASWLQPGITTGFSGTNDNRSLLPLNIEQRTSFSETELLDYLYKQGIRVLIDAGAFIMEMDNVAVARAWIQADWKAKGAVFFDVNDNKPWVMYRNFKRVPLFASPFADDLEGCLVYLDMAHTRGTDLRMPPNAIGAVTLGLGQTKDHTVQAAMRLRQLGSTQSVMFIAPPEVHQSILDVGGKTSSAALDSSDVVAWLLDQTCTTNRELQPLYFSQGKDHLNRMQAAVHCKKFLTSPQHRRAYLEVLQQPEQQTLEQLYEPTYRETTDFSVSPVAATSTGRIAGLIKELQKRRQESQAFESAFSSLALEEVEQEREVAFEVEEEREVQRPRHPKALRFPGLHQSILDFAKGGLLSHSHILTAAEVLETTHIGEKYKIEGSLLVPHVYVSEEFTRTIRQKKAGKDDTYTRPVQWLLYNTVTETALVIIPEEAEELIPIMRAWLPPNTHLILYAAPWTKSMLHFNNLDYYSLPDLPDGWAPPGWLPFELGILAGRLYFSFSEYEGILSRLHLLPQDSTEETEFSTLSAAAKNRLNFLQEWLAIRRQGQAITDTPMGYVCQGWPLHSDHPFFNTKKVKVDADNTLGLESLRIGDPEQEDEYYTDDADDGDEEVGMGDSIELNDEVVAGLDPEPESESEPRAGNDSDCDTDVDFDDSVPCMMVL